MFYAMQMEAERIQERIERDFAFAAARRLTRSRAHAVPSVARSVAGSSEIGTRIAAEPSFESVRSL